MAGSFVDGIQKLLDATPDKVTGHVVVDQVYAHYQHEHPEFHHPDGGQAFYLSEPLALKAHEYFGRLGREAVHGRLKEAMIENVEDLSKEVYNRAPWEFGDLRASGHPIVEEDGHVVYDRPPMCRRLTEDELDAVIAAVG
mgnify:CR=1 FL=1